LLSCTRRVLRDPAPADMSPGGMRALDDLGLSIGAYALVLDLLVAIGFCAVGTFIFLQRSRERGPLFVSFALVLFGLTWPGVFDAAQSHPAWGGLAGFLIQLGLSSILVFFFLFPDGRFVPRWTSWVAVLAFAQPVLHVLFPGSPFVGLPEPLNVLVFIALWVTCLYAQVYR
jgi:hypothetical protein